MTTDKLNKSERIAKARSVLQQFEKSCQSTRQSLSSATAADKKTAAWQEGRSLALSYIGIDKGKSSGQVRNKLRQKGVADELIDSVVESLINDDYIDDRRACAKISRRHQGSKAKSRRYMRELFLKYGVDREVAEAYLAQLPEDQDSIQGLLPDEMPTVRKENERLIRRLQSRGYSYQIIRSALDRKEA